jgi:WD40-like Beta Propeller Repeat
MRRVLLVGLATCAALALGPGGAAGAADLIYLCGPNLCKVRADGSGRQQLTRDGKRGGPAYGWVSASRDGSRLGTSFGNDAFVLDRNGRRVGGALPDSGGAVPVVQISPDGRSVATIESLLELVNPPTLTPVPYLFLTDLGSRERDTVARSVTTTGWLGDRLMRSEPSDASPFEQRICLLASNPAFQCERPVAADPGREVWMPAASPDGRFVAAVQAPLDRTAGPIGIFDSASGRLVRTVTDGSEDALPAWSPDGARIAFTRGDALYVVPAGGGTARRVAGGSQAVWVPGQVLRLSAPARARVGTVVQVRVRAPGAPARAEVSLQRRVGRRWVVLATRTVVRGRSRFRLRLGPGRQRLRAVLRAPRTPPLASRVVTLRVR